jgi:hypothetical protein
MQRQVICQVNDNTKLIRIPLRSLVQEIEDWDENRVLDEDKVNEIINSYKKRDIALITSLFRCAVYPNGYKVLLDGHHRKEAAKEFLKDFINFDENIDVFVVMHNKINDEDNDDIYDLHIKSNLATPLSDWQIPTTKRSDLIKAFRNDAILKNGLSTSPNAKKAHQPKISLNELAELAGKIIIKYSDMPVELIIHYIKQINKLLSLAFTRDNLSNITLRGHKIKTEIIDKAHELKFYLNIRDSKVNKDVWVHFISNPNEISALATSE